MISTTLFPGRYVQGAGVMKQLGEEVTRFGNKALVICDPFVYDELWPQHRSKVQDSIKISTEKFNGESSDEEIERLTKLAQNEGADIIIGIGGGKTLDTAKAIAESEGLTVVIVPTIASTDAPCSSLSVIYSSKGEFKRYDFHKRNPDLVLVDTEIIAQAPVRFLNAGMGDALATWFEAESCQRNYADNMAGRLGSLAAYRLAETCYETLLEYGILAKEACELNVVTPALEHIVEANTLLSGLGFESGGLAAAHAIHNGLTVLEPTHKYHHGEKVAFGTLTTLLLTDRPKETIKRVYEFCSAVDLPLTLADLGLDEVSDKDLQKVAERACAENETIHNEPIPISPTDVVYAMKEADRLGRHFKENKSIKL